MPRPKSTPRLLTRRSPSTGRLLAFAKFDGRTVSFGPMGKAARERFEQTLAGWLANGRQFDRADRARTYMLGQLVDDYEAHSKVYYRHQADGRPTTSVDRIRQAVRPLKDNLGALPAEDFDLAALRDYRDQLVAAGLSRVTVNGKVQAVKQMFAWAAEEERVPPEVAVRLKVLRTLQRGRSKAVDLPARKPVEWAVVEVTLPHLSRPLRALILTMWHTAMRVGEATQLCSKDVDMSGDVWMFRPRRHKTLHHGKAREIDIGRAAQAVLRPFVRLKPDAPWFSPQEAVRDHHHERRRHRTTRLWDSHVRRQRAKRRPNPKRLPGESYDCHSVSHAIRRAIDRINRSRPSDQQLPPWSTHQLRHAALSRVRKEFGIEAALAIGGHGSFAVTEGYTDTARRDLAREVARKIG